MPAGAGANRRAVAGAPQEWVWVRGGLRRAVGGPELGFKTGGASLARGPVGSTPTRLRQIAELSPMGPSGLAGTPANLQVGNLRELARRADLPASPEHGRRRTGAPAPPATVVRATRGRPRPRPSPRGRGARFGPRVGVRRAVGRAVNLPPVRPHTAASRPLGAYRGLAGLGGADPRARRRASRRRRPGLRKASHRRRRRKHQRCRRRPPEEGDTAHGASPSAARRPAGPEAVHKLAPLPIEHLHLPALRAGDVEPVAVRCEATGGGARARAPPPACAPSPGRPPADRRLARRTRRRGPRPATARPERAKSRRSSASGSSDSGVSRRRRHAADRANATRTPPAPEVASAEPGGPRPRRARGAPPPQAPAGRLPPSDGRPGARLSAPRPAARRCAPPDAGGARRPRECPVGRRGPVPERQVGHGPRRRALQGQARRELAGGTDRVGRPDGAGAQVEQGEAAGASGPPASPLPAPRPGRLAGAPAAPLGPGGGPERRRRRGRPAAGPRRPGGPPPAGAAAPRGGPGPRRAARRRAAGPRGRRAGRGNRVAVAGDGSVVAGRISRSAIRIGDEYHRYRVAGPHDVPAGGRAARLRPRDAARLRRFRPLRPRSVRLRPGDLRQPLAAVARGGASPSRRPCRPASPWRSAAPR